MQEGSPVRFPFPGYVPPLAYQSARRSFLPSFPPFFLFSFFFTLPSPYPFSFFRVARRCTARYPTAELLRITTTTTTPERSPPQRFDQEKKIRGRRVRGWEGGGARGGSPSSTSESVGWPSRSAWPAAPQALWKKLRYPPNDFFSLNPISHPRTLITFLGEITARRVATTAILLLMFFFNTDLWG